MKTLGIVISTPGRSSISRTLQSIYYQCAPVEDVLIVGDGYHEPTRELVAEWAHVGLPVRYVATRKTRDWGHSQVNYGLQHVAGDYVTYQDDDDIYLPRALEEMSRLASKLETPHPILGRVKTPLLGLIWQRPDQTTCLDGHCLVAPNDKRKLGWMDGGYNGDQCLLHTTLRNYDQLAWTDRVWTLTRPSWKLMPWAECRVPRDGGWRWTLTPVGDWGARVTLCMRPTEGDAVEAWITGEAPNVTREELGEVAQFAVFAAQGKDVRFTVSPAGAPAGATGSASANSLMRAALLDWGYKEHTTTELTYDWPPRFWPEVAPFTHLAGPDGEPLDDWRSESWGGRGV